jgi:hypothetical protein
MTMSYDETIKWLQKEAIEFLKSHYLVVNGVEIYPKEIEVYRYEKEGEFKDVYVHCSKKQANRHYKFYVHEKGRGGCDLVISESDNVYYSYLIRSIVIGGELIVGPLNSFDAICARTGLPEKELEDANVTVEDYNNDHNVFTDTRIGLVPNEKDKGQIYLNAELRFILCDECYKPQEDKKKRYKNRERALTNFMLQKLAKGEMTKDEVFEEAKKYLGYVPKSLKEC